MAEYQLTANEHTICRVADSAYIPDDPGNRDYVEYLAWCDAGGVADPYVEPEKTPLQPTAEQRLTLDHENRIRALEGQPPLTFADFVDRMADV